MPGKFMGSAKVIGCTLLISSVLVASGCVSQQKRPYYACHFGEQLEELCAQTEVDEDRELVCVDLSKNTRFELTKCNTEVRKKTYKFF